MDKGLKIAIGGKGGVGKTTVCSVWAKLFAKDGCDVLAIDADPDANLASAFGLPADRHPEPLINMKELIAERTGTDRNAVAAYFRLNPNVADLPERYCLDVPVDDAKGSLKLLVAGAVTQAGAGCACPEAAFLKALLSHSVLQRKEVVIVDLAAGVEFMGRAAVAGVDCLVTVVEPGLRSIRSALEIARMARPLGIAYVAAIANKITSPQEADTIRSHLKGVEILGNVEYSTSFREADLAQKDVFSAAEAAVKALTGARDALMKKCRA
jgi:CO dehydrogenase maturation factor